jgi:hypothetical protein
LFPREKFFRFGVDSDSILNPSELSFDHNRLFQVGGGEYSAARCNVQSENDINLFLDRFENALHDESVTHVIRKDIHLVLPDREILTQLETVLISN